MVGKTFDTAPAPRHAPDTRRMGFGRPSPANVARALVAGEVPPDSPLGKLLAIMWDKRQPMKLRLKAAAAAAPYVHRKLKAVEPSGDASLVVVRDALSEQ